MKRPLIPFKDFKTYKDNQKKIHQWINSVKPTGVACPKCEKEMLTDPSVFTASLPPKAIYKCSNCSHVEYV